MELIGQGQRLQPLPGFLSSFSWKIAPLSLSVQKRTQNKYRLGHPGRCRPNRHR